MTCWRSSLLSSNAFEIALSVYYLPVFIGNFVFVQVDWLAAHWADELPVPSLIMNAHGTASFTEGPNLSHLYATVQFDIEPSCPGLSCIDRAIGSA